MSVLPQKHTRINGRQNKTTVQMTNRRLYAFLSEMPETHRLLLNQLHSTYGKLL
jgi:hypothetical protein